eukprot:CAMPEP_0179055576 /NCGR_PEP_ID=MMETSP0796-20121207/23373_1 /TAXON_ID=73915 /ORGANISM="Pyrodinium bahamense, Strain pbaha01" /LENGTH=348 /DNA_ID=CAMNT_0020752235 /DNA_START=59 /DNA_END=1106 /DNA_ORIENTATION=+
MFCGKFCACCPPPLPAPLTHQQQPRPLGSVALTVRLLSGELLMEMGVGDHVRADELKLEVEVKASAWLAKAGCCIRALLWGATELGGARTLSELGMGGKEEVVAVCARSIEGDFEKFRPGCPTCDAYSTVTRMRFELSGVASLSFTCQGAEETRTFRYTLGEVEEGDGPRGLRRRLRLDEATRVFEGWLEFDAADPIQRRVRVEGLDLVPRMPLCAPRDAPAELDLEDLRALQLRGKDEARMRKRLLFQSYDIKGFWGAEREEDVPLWDPKHVEEEGTFSNVSSPVPGTNASASGATGARSRGTGVGAAVSVVSGVRGAGATGSVGAEGTCERKRRERALARAGQRGH